MTNAKEEVEGEDSEEELFGADEASDDEWAGESCSHMVNQLS